MLWCGVDAYIRVLLNVGWVYPVTFERDFAVYSFGLRAGRFGTVFVDNYCSVGSS